MTEAQQGFVHFAANASHHGEASTTTPYSIGMGLEQNPYMVLLHHMRQQIEYYFSPHNYSRDAFLQHVIAAHQGSVPVHIIANFPKIQQLYYQMMQYSYNSALAAPIEVIVCRALAYSDHIKVSNDGYFLLPLWTVAQLAEPPMPDSRPTDASVHSMDGAKRERPDTAKADVANPTDTTNTTASPTSFVSGSDESVSQTSTKDDTTYPHQLHHPTPVLFTQGGGYFVQPSHTVHQPYFAPIAQPIIGMIPPTAQQFPYPSAYSIGHHQQNQFVSMEQQYLPPPYPQSFTQIGAGSPHIVTQAIPHGQASPSNGHRSQQQPFVSNTNNTPPLQDVVREVPIMSLPPTVSPSEPPTMIHLHDPSIVSPPQHEGRPPPQHRNHRNNSVKNVRRQLPYHRQSSSSSGRSGGGVGRSNSSKHPKKPPPVVVGSGNMEPAPEASQQVAADTPLEVTAVDDSIVTLSQSHVDDDNGRGKSITKQQQQHSRARGNKSNKNRPYHKTKVLTTPKEETLLIDEQFPYLTKDGVVTNRIFDLDPREDTVTANVGGSTTTNMFQPETRTKKKYAEALLQSPMVDKKVWIPSSTGPATVVPNEADDTSKRLAADSKVSSKSRNDDDVSGVSGVTKVLEKISI
jgi:La domain